MRIASWNIRQDGGTRAALISQQLERWEPDVVALAEMRHTPAIHSIANGLIESGLVHQASTTDSSDPLKYGVFLASRYPIQLHPASGILSELGRWIHTTIECDSPFDCMVMHVPNRGEGDKYGFHNAVVEQFVKVKDSPAIAMGDTNSGVPKIDEQAPFLIVERSPGSRRSNRPAGVTYGVSKTR